MDYTVWYAGTLIGRTDLATPLPSVQPGQLVPAPDVRTGRLVPAPEFAGAWAHIGPVMNELMAAGMATGSPLSEIHHAAGDSTAVRGQRVHDWMMAHPAGVRLRVALEAAKAVGLGVRDATGQVIPAESIWIQETRLPDGISMADIERAMAEAREDGFDTHFPYYAVSLTTKRDETTTVR